MKCKKCGEEISEESVFCNKCGTKILVEEIKEINSDTAIIDEQTQEEVNGATNKVSNIKISKKKLVFLLFMVSAIVVGAIFIGYMTDYTFSYKTYKLKVYNSLDSNGYTYLDREIKSGNMDKVKELINYGVNLNVDTNNPLICLCVKYGNKEMCELLIKKGASISLTDANKDTPLLIATKLKKDDIVKVLLKNGADASIKDKNNETSMDIASRNKDKAFFKYLSSNGKDLVLIKKLQDHYISDTTKKGELYAPKDKNFLIKNSDIINFFMVNGNKVLLDEDGEKIYEGAITDGEITGYGVVYTKDTSFESSEDIISEKNSGSEGKVAGQIIYKGNWKDGLWQGEGKIYNLKQTKAYLGMDIGVEPKLSAQEVDVAFLKQKNDVETEDTFINGTHDATNDPVQQVQPVQPVIEEPTIGMTADAVRKSTWGNPQKINRTTNAYGTTEQWVYDFKYLYFDVNGLLTDIQD
ncbi:ankyrin repeat domain-containing protein [Clostridium estertheticum]|uniref:ankyrin repeat domain-containing protein n=1 Tax=Clostridium estertheticum TaxID=238834 RepID=UPI001C6E5CA1|nr:ankyrin repeat domain-containing protein [Clostridium estertheticum]MBW9169735.1 ankyrin repeat domain-containing protein [Clostridium estertheticum]WLC74757.1 ankyrin repeat domain-containing protein [Clostridium estertheticum]